MPNLIEKFNLDFFANLDRRKIVKVVTLVILTLACGYFSAKIVLDFIEDPIAVKVTEHLESEVLLPDIMICPMYPLNITKLRLDGFPDEAISAFHWHFVQDQYNQIGRNDLLEYRSTFEIPNVTHFADRDDWEIFVKNYSLSCSGLFIYCSFNFVGFNCCEKAQQVLHEKQGLCHKLSKHDYPFDSKVKVGDGATGLVLLLNVPDFNASGITVTS